MVRSAYQHRIRSGSHSAASLSLFWSRLTPGDASVRFRRSEANSGRVAGLEAHRPMSWASERATMCSMSASLPNSPVSCCPGLGRRFGLDHGQATSSAFARRRPLSATSGVFRAEMVPRSAKGGRGA